MIDINQLSKTYTGGVQALRQVSLHIASTGMFGLLGPNGAGKTTLMRILAGLITPSQGQVKVFGNDVTSPTGKLAAKTLLGYLPQELGLYPNLSATEFLDYIAILKGVTDAKQRRQQIAEVLEAVRLSDVAKRQLNTFSGGMKRRVGIAQALLGDPKLLIVDEPTVGLDPEERVRLRNLFSDMATRCIVILSTHIVEDISQSCNDLAVIAKGSVLFRGSPRDLMSAARGQVWNILSPDGNLAVDKHLIVSSLQLAEGTQYRVLGTPDPATPAQPVEPSLEDGYMWLMSQKGK
jgi:ABC-type multidrug transport system ATPase subunit